MSASIEPVPALPRLSDLERLEQVVRPEFRVATYYPSRDDPVLWGPTCRVEGCPGGRVSIGEPRLCSTHYLRWRDAARPEVEAFAEQAVQLEQAGVHRAIDPDAQRETFAFRLGDLPERLLLEIQYGLQCRHDERRSRLFTNDFARAVEAVGRAGVESLIATEHRWRNEGTRGARAFLRYTAKQVARLLDADHLLDRDVWHPADFPQAEAHLQVNLHLTHIRQDWLRQPAKRWLKLRLDTGSKWSTVHANLEALRRFSEFIEEVAEPPRSMDQVTREHLVDYLAWLAGRGMAAESRNKAIGGVRIFLDDYRLQGWPPALRPTALFRRGDAPAVPDALPRPIDEFVMRQIEAEENLATLPLEFLAILVIGIRCGLRSGDVLALPFEPLREDSTGQHTLVYVNRKSSRETALPIVHAEVVDVIRRQQQAVLERFPAGCLWLFPRATGNPDGRLRTPYATLRTALRRWLSDQGIHDATGRPARVTFHQFRHTFGTRLIESGASEHLVQRLMDHRNARTTRGYAELSDRSKRDEFFKYTRVNNRGDEVQLNPGSPIGDAEWMKEQLNRAQVTLPNGYCTLPLTQPCDMRNACIDCDPYFVTTVEFVEIHRKQRDETKSLMARAEVEGNRRLVEKNAPLLERLDTIVQSLEEG